MPADDSFRLSGIEIRHNLSIPTDLLRDFPPNVDCVLQFVTNTFPTAPAPVVHSHLNHPIPFSVASFGVSIELKNPILRDHTIQRLREDTFPNALPGRIDTNRRAMMFRNDLVVVHCGDCAAVVAAVLVAFRWLDK